MSIRLTGSIVALALGSLAGCDAADEQAADFTMPTTQPVVVTPEEIEEEIKAAMNSDHTDALAMLEREARTQPSAGLENVFDGFEESLSRPEWHVMHLPLPPSMLEMAFLTQDEASLAETIGHVEGARGFVMNDRSTGSRARLTVFRLDDPEWTETFVQRCNDGDASEFGKSRAGVEITEPPTIGELAGITADVATELTVATKQMGLEFQFRTLRAARGAVVIEVYNQGLDLDDAVVLAAMEKLFERAGATP